MPITLDELREARRFGVQTYQTWKRQIKVNDEIAADLWEVIGDDDTREDSEPLVENIYVGALEDKYATAGQSDPLVLTWPKRGTRKDTGERQANTQRQVHLTYRDRSTITAERLRMKLFRDWFHAGAMYLTPWANFFDVMGQRVPESMRMPYYIRQDPRAAYPLARNSRDELTQFMSINQRNVGSLRKELGKDHPSIMELERQRGRGVFRDDDYLEEVWYYDTTSMARALVDAGVQRQFAGSLLIPTEHIAQQTHAENLIWVHPPSFHGLGLCPVAGVERITHDDRQPRGAIEKVIPQLRVAQNFMRRLLDDLAFSIHSPVIIDGVVNPEEYGLGAVMEGDGTGNARFVRDRPPVNFEAQQTVRSIMDQVRSLAKQPQQRGGQAGASIISDRAVNSVQAEFNEQLGWAMGDVAGVLSQAHKRTAMFDRTHCRGTKTVRGLDGLSAFEFDYDPVDLFDTEPLVEVTYGPDKGLEQQQKITTLALASNVGWLSKREAAQRSGLVPDALHSERERAIEALIGDEGIFFTQVLPQQIVGGNLQAIIDFVDKIDDDSVSLRQAVFDTIRESLQPVAEAAPGTPGPNPTADIIQQVRSLQAGGVPDQAEGLPVPGRQLQSVLPSGQQRLAQEAG